MGCSFFIGNDSSPNQWLLCVLSKLIEPNSSVYTVYMANFLCPHSQTVVTCCLINTCLDMEVKGLFAYD